MSEITQADREAAAQVLGEMVLGNEDRAAQVIARHRQYGYDQGYYDGRQYDGAEERAKIVAYLRKTFGFDNDAADEIEAGEHLK